MDVTRATTVGDAWRGRPGRYLASRWPWRALAYVVSGVPIGLLTLLWLPVSLLGARTPMATLERRRLGLLGGPPVPDPRAATWRELAYAVLHATVLLAVDIAGTLLAVVVPVGGIAFVLVDAVGRHIPAAVGGLVLALLVLPAIGAYVAALVAVGHGEIARALLGPDEAETVRVLTRSRARLVDAFEVERRRIERDLHDGAQQRLVALTMTLGLAELERDDPEATHALVSKAAAQSRAALADLRDLVRGIHPRVLTDLGLPAAVAELAQGCGVPLTIALDVPGRLPSTVESAAYFVAAEAISNTVKHSGATRAWITGGVDAGRLVVEVRDDGVGGADPIRGTGLAGLADRVDALAGTLALASPIGGPTILRLELPCSG